MRGNVIATVYVFFYRHSITVHLNSSLTRQGSLLSCCLCFTQNVRRKNFSTRSAVQLSTQSIDRILCNSDLISSLIQASSSFSARARYSEYVYNSNSTNFLRPRIWWSSCCTAPTLAVLPFEKWKFPQWLAVCVQSMLWRVQLCSMNCSHDLVLRTVY